MCFGKRKTPRHLIIQDHDYRPQKAIGLPWLFVALGVLIGSMVISMAVAASDELYEAKSGQLMFQNSKGMYKPSLHLKSHADVSINGLVAKITLAQTFTNHTDAWQEGVYIFPLPESSAVNHMEMRIGDRRIIGEIKEKQQAKKIYQQAKQTGKRAALTEQLRPNIFTQRVANIGPDQEVEITITYVQNIRYDKGEFSWRFPMTITPRYFPRQQSANIPSGTQDIKKNSTFDESEQNNESPPISNPDKSVSSQVIASANGWASSPVVQSMDAWPLPASINEFHDLGTFNPISLNISLDSGLPLEHIGAPYHDIHISKKQKIHAINLVDNTVNMDRDFVLNWRPTQSSAPQAALFSEEIDGDFYSLLMLIPPTKKHTVQGLARDMIFIIDTSGSMGGASITQAKSSLIDALSRLNAQDRFNIIEFNSDYTKLFPQLAYATPSNTREANKWISSLNAGGGTNMLPALNASFKQYQNSESLEQTIFITDGAVGNETELFSTIRNNLGNTRLFTVGIGSAPNSYFMKKSAEFGRGSFTYIGDINRVSEKINALFDKLDGAIAKNIDIQWPSDAQIYPNNIPDLYLSEPLLISAKSKSLNGDVEIRGTTSDALWQKNIVLDNHKSNEGVASIWARAKIEDLEDLKISGGNPDILKLEITNVALKHSLLSAYTSFVAVEQEIVRPSSSALKSTPIQNALPKGHSAAKKTRSIAYPATATTAEISWWVGLFFTLFLIVYRRMSKD
ncbi:MAG: marine proteobacterial sortase target protein [Agarilytica sp.]